MKYKINYKALDEVYDHTSIIEFMEKNGYYYYNYDYDFLYFKKTELDRKIRFNVNFKRKLITKYILIHTNIGIEEVDAEFTKEELKFFDLLDYEINPVTVKTTGQDITDWVNM
jgi:hydrogenase maturation factor